MLPVIEGLAKRTELMLSVDTRRARVAEAALAAGARIVNAVSGLRDPELASVCAAHGATLVLNHMRGEPATMQRAPAYADVVREVRDELLAEAARAERAGVARERIWLDPGLGFGKHALRHNLPLLAGLEALVATGLPVLVGASRKSFLGALTGASVSERLPGSLAVATAAVLAGARGVRAHDVAETRQAVDVALAIRSARSAVPRVTWLVYTWLLERWETFAENFQPLRDSLDILVVAWCVYWLLMRIKGTRAAQMALGLLILVLAWRLSDLLELATVSFLLDNFLSSGLLILIVIFQADIRRALTRVGRGLFAPARMQEAHTIEEIVRACQALAQRRVGALVAIERDVQIDEFVEQGTPLDAELSRDLLISLFLPYSPLHDGAVVVRRGRIATAGCILPLAMRGERLRRARHAPPRGDRHHRGDRRARRRRLRGDGQDLARRRRRDPRGPRRTAPAPGAARGDRQARACPRSRRRGRGDRSGARGGDLRCRWASSTTCSTRSWRS